MSDHQSICPDVTNKYKKDMELQIDDLLSESHLGSLMPPHARSRTRARDVVHLKGS